jgi:hypothetical protein
MFFYYSKGVDRLRMIGKGAGEHYRELGFIPENIDPQRFRFRYSPRNRTKV